jgi:hypothetical protein
VALEQGKVDAWAGLDPHMAASELESGSRLLYRNVAFNTYGFLNVREAFLASAPGETARVIKAYERARLDPRQSGRGGQDPVRGSQGLAAGGAPADQAAQRLFASRSPEANM